MLKWVSNSGLDGRPLRTYLVDCCIDLHVNVVSDLVGPEVCGQVDETMLTETPLHKPNGEKDVSAVLLKCW